MATRRTLLWLGAFALVAALVVGANSLGTLNARVASLEREVDRARSETTDLRNEMRALKGLSDLDLANAAQSEACPKRADEDIRAAIRRVNMKWTGSTGTRVENDADIRRYRAREARCWEGVPDPEAWMEDQLTGGR